MGTIWSNDKKIIRNNTISQKNRSKKASFMRMNFKSNSFLMNTNNTIVSQNNKSQNHRKNVKKNLPWAVATWHLFHIIPAQISDENFVKYKKPIVEFIITCCNKLPCPYCKSHAQNYLRYNNIRLVNTKKELEIFLYKFHNKAHRVEKNIPWNDCMLQYKSMNMDKVLYEFEIHFFKSFIGGRYFSDWIRNGFKDNYNSFKILLKQIIV